MKIIIKKDKVLHADLSFRLCGICFSVHNKLGRFRSEKSYSDALEQEFKENNIQYKREFSIGPSFSGESGRRNVVDFVVEDKIILEVKAVPVVARDEYYQVQRYLQASNLELGILINFQRNYLQPKRILNTSSELLDSDVNL